MNKLSSQYILDIIAAEMKLGQDQLWIKNQNRKIPNDDRLYVVAGIVDSHPFSNITKFAPTGDLMEEQQGVVIQENVQVDVFSKSIMAAQRAWEVIAALNSLTAQQMQQKFQFKIFRQPRNFTDTSSIEGGSQINRYTLVFPVHALYQKDQILSQNGGLYYDDFTQRVDDSQTIGEPAGLIEFEITSAGVTTNDR